MVNCFYDSYTVLNKVYGEKAFFKQALNSTPIEEKNRALTVKLCYGVLDKDIELSYYISVLAPKNPKAAIRTILKIAAYAIKYLNKREYAVIDSAVELTKKLGKTGASGFVNAFLRRFAVEKDDIALPTDRLEYLSVKYSFPPFAVKKLVNDYGEERTIEILSCESDKNCVVFYGEDGEGYLKNFCTEYQKTSYDNVFLTKGFRRNADYDKGVYTFQALGSVAICDSVEKGKNLLDCCAAPGGKSVRLSFKFDNVLSADIHEHRVELINDYCARMKINNVKTVVCDSKVFNPELFERFDAVLCDAPCSGLGVTTENPDIKINRSEQNVEELKKEQIDILNNVKKYVKIGGYLYYSTCSILKEENEGTVLRFLSENPDYVEEKLTSKIESLPCRAGITFLPDKTCGSGFYVCKLKRER